MKFLGTVNKYDLDVKGMKDFPVLLLVYKIVIQVAKFSGTVAFSLFFLPVLFVNLQGFDKFPLYFSTILFVFSLIIQGFCTAFYSFKLENSKYLSKI